jgi:CBS domain-containing protein
MARATGERTVHTNEPTGREGSEMPTGTTLDPTRHSFLAPAFERATVVDAIRMGVVRCPPDSSLREVARIMVTYRIHWVVVSEVEGNRAVAVVSDADLAAAANADIDRLTAGQLVTTEAVTVEPDATMALAAQLMAERKVNHLVVVQPGTDHPVAVLSALDLAGVLAWGGTE